MKKRLKVVALVVAMMLLLSVLVSCSTGNEEAAETKTAEEPAQAETADGAQAAAGEGFVIGVPWWDFNDPTYDSALNNMKNAIEGAGGTILTEMTADTSPDSLIDSVQKLINAGVDGIQVVPLAESVIPKIQQMCEDEGIAFGFICRMITDPEIKSGLEKSEYFSGAAFENEEETAYNSIIELSDIGAKNICIISGPIGDTASDARDRGIDRAVEETGIKVLSTVRDMKSAADVTKAVESFVAAFPEMDSLFMSYCSATGAMPAMQKVLETNGIAGKIIVGRIDFDSSMAEYFEKGQLQLVYGGQMQIDPYVSTLLLVNKVNGTPVAESPMFVEVSYMKLTSTEDAENYFKHLEGDIPVYTAEEQQQFLKYVNSDVNEQTILDSVANFSLADVVERHKDLVK